MPYCESDIKLLTENYHQINPTKSLPSIIKVTEIYEGGPHAGTNEVMYHITQRTETSAHGVATHNPTLTCEIDVTAGDVELKEGVYHTTAIFVWDQNANSYISKPEETEEPAHLGKACVNC